MRALKRLKDVQLLKGLFMKKLLPVVLSVALFSPSSNAASQDECAIWLCLPSAFPAGCAAAYSAFRKRVRKLKPPLPPLASCVVGGGVTLPNGVRSSVMTYDHGLAALVDVRRECVEYTRDDIGACVRWKTIPRHWVKGTRCRTHDGGETPAGCILTRDYVDVFADGVPVGETYYF